MSVSTAAAYARFSTDNQTENSIDYQMYEINNYCQQQQINLTHRFVDEGLTGTNVDRNGFLDMIASARRREFTNIIIYDVTRGSRDVADWFYFRKCMRELNINVISCKQKLGDILNPNDFLHELITVGLGQHSVLETRQKSLDGVSSAARKGKFLGGHAPFGYEIKDGYYVIIPSEAIIVKNVFELYAAGYSYGYILDKLNIHGIVGRHGKKMSSNSLYYMLKNARYAGTYVWNEYTYQVMRKYVGSKPNPRIVKIDDAIPAIVSKEIFDIVQERLEMNKSQCRSHEAKQRVFLLSGLIHCSVCGANYVAHMSTSKGWKYVYYCCGNRYKKHQGGTCSTAPVRGEALEDFVVDAVKKYLADGTNFEALAQHIADKFNEAAPDVSAERNELSSLDVKIQNGIQAILSGFDAPELRQQIEQLKARKEELQKVIAATENSQRRIDVAALAAILQEDVHNLASADPAVVQVTIRRHVPYITANEDGSFTIAVGYALAGEKKKTAYPFGNTVAHSVAGAEGLEPSTNGFGDRYSTN